jgi:MFS transporter, FSR family, fosmidomycin resistance protein
VAQTSAGGVPWKEGPQVDKCDDHGGFGVLLCIGILDTATRMGYLLFLPFLIHARGGSSVTVGLGLALLFIGGALGKASCGWLGQRVGVVASVVATEIATAALIAATCFTPNSPRKRIQAGH